MKVNARKKAKNRPKARTRISLQYTVRGISPTLDGVLREKARKSSLSLNDTTLQAIKNGVGIQEDSNDDLDHLIGKWEQDADFEQAITQQRKIDNDLWD